MRWSKKEAIVGCGIAGHAEIPACPYAFPSENAPMTIAYPHTQLLIDNAWCEAASGRRHPVVNPATGATIGSFAWAEQADLDRALESAERGFKAWRKMSAYDRSKIMRKAANLLRERIDLVSTLMTMEQGKPYAEAKAETFNGADTIDWFAEEARRAYRDMIVTTPHLGDAISGAILYDETIRQQTLRGLPFARALEDAGIIPGIKVDAGAKALAAHPGEFVTEGLDGLREQLAEYATMGARFARSPSRGCIEANAHALARYAGLCQEAGLVPIVEPEVLMDGDHSLERCSAVTQAVLHAVFDQLDTQRVMLEGMLLKPNMVLPGLAAVDQGSVDQVADATVHCFLRTVPAAVPGIAFLSGGQSAELASARLNAMNLRFAGRLPWALAFSFARAIQQPALEIWRGVAANVPVAQQALGHRADCNRLARRGRYDSNTDAGAAAAPGH